ncbi:hypothetical protein SynBMKMC1_02306 [Synechococcus sp. BMK-MC-1]|nr:hypothetical protein SynBMKMC1_02306 [Synechococcus sp. BMK-MC-1]
MVVPAGCSDATRFSPRLDAAAASESPFRRIQSRSVLGMNRFQSSRCR